MIPPFKMDDAQLAVLVACSVQLGTGRAALYRETAGQQRGAVFEAHHGARRFGVNLRVRGEIGRLRVTGRHGGTLVRVPSPAPRNRNSGSYSRSPPPASAGRPRWIEEWPSRSCTTFGCTPADSAATRRDRAVLGDPIATSSLSMTTVWEIDAKTRCRRRLKEPMCSGTLQPTRGTTHVFGCALQREERSWDADL